MPKAPAAPCPFPGCGVVGRCATHSRQRYRERNSARITRSPWQAFYLTGEWSRARRAVLQREPMCRRCGKRAEVVDHITPLSEGGARTDPLNLQPLCKGCHNRKTDEDKRRRM